MFVINDRGSSFQQKNSIKPEIRSHGFLLAMSSKNGLSESSIVVLSVILRICDIPSSKKCTNALCATIFSYIILYGWYVAYSSCL